MGRLGGREMGYSSDADVLFVHDPRAGRGPRARAGVRPVGHDDAAHAARHRRARSRRWRSTPTCAPRGATVRWSARSTPTPSTTTAGRPRGRARRCCGRARWPATRELGERFVELVAPLRYPAGGVDPSVEREIRRIKARVESERLPRGVEPARHLKLGRGGISDVEWTAQLLQLQHAHAVPGLRTTGTLEALEAAASAGLLDAEDARVLAEAWLLASRLRDANVLWTGRGGAHADLLPHDRQALAGLARVVGYPAGSGGELEQDYLRTARRARAVVERVFYG